MSELFQIGQHPDADQLSAFAEDALPAHERRQTLAHLAECAHCRRIVSLSLPAFEGTAQPQTLPVRKPWFHGWNLAWPVAAAMAVAAIFAVHLHNAGTPGGPAPQPVQIAQAIRPEPVAVPSAAPPPPAALDKMVPRPALKPQSKTPPPVEILGAVGGSRARDNGVATGNESVANLPLNGRNVTTLEARKTAPPMARPMAPMGGPLSQNQLRTLDASPQNTQASGAQFHGEQKSETAAASAGSAAELNFQQPQPAQSGTADASITASSAADTVTVNASPQQLDVTNVSSFAPAMPASHSALPSGLGVSSTISRGSQTLALDAGGGLFLSVDGGRHWKPVAPPWAGRAVTVQLASAQVAAKKVSGMAALGGSAKGIALPPASTSTASLSGTVTDSTGAAIPGATVAANDPRTGLARAAKTDAAGRYTIAGLSAGAYGVEASAPGFRQTRAAATLTASQPTILNVTLAVGAATETVTVEAESARIAEQPAKALKALKQSPPPPPAPLAFFQVITQSGERWTSPDAEHWARQ